MANASKLPLLTRLAYGFGAAAYGVKDSAFGYFLLLFYGTVVGLDGRLVGLALLFILVFDAISDPIVGYISDNWRSKWGRRHPFMYAAAIPVPVAFYFLWSPPDWSDEALLIYLVALAALIRTLITFYETPSSSLLPELASDYDQRASLQAFRNYFGWTGGNAMSLIGFGLIFAVTPQNPAGLMNRDAYANFGLLGSCLIFIAIMVSALGTHSRIPTFEAPPPKRKLTLGQIFGEIIETLRDRSFFALFAATLFGGIATGVGAGLTFLISKFFWQFSELQIFYSLVLVMGSAVLGSVIAPIFVRKFGKKKAAIIVGVLAFSIAPLTVVLRLFGLMPENGHPLLYPIVIGVNTLDVALIIAAQIILYSMIADLVEVNELKTGRRSEGVFYAAVTFVRKTSQGLGAVAAGFVLAFASMPETPIAGEVAADTLFRLGLGYAPTLWILWTCMLISISLYKVTREEHAENLAELARRKAVTADVSSG